MRCSLTFTTLLVTAATALSQDAATTTIFKRFEEARPTEKNLAFYALDWVCSLKEARQRAQTENRPILLILNTNITAHCNFYSGHT